jgi:hypothetical protein
VGSNPFCLLLPLAHNRELTVAPEYPGYRLAIRRRDGDEGYRFEGGFNLAAAEIAVLRVALEQLAPVADSTGFPG